MPERAIVQATMRLLRKRGAWAFNLHGTVFGRNGLPDIHATYRGTPIVIETKRPGRRPTPLQQHELDRAAKAGARTLVATNVRQVEQLLDQIDEDLQELAA